MRATVTVEGTHEEIEALIRALASGAPGVHVQVGLEVALPPGAREELAAADMLRPVERAIVLMDLRGEPRRQIASQLELSAGTVTVYRRLIRLRLRGIPEEQRPPWMLMWLRRFPGMAPPQPPAPPAEPETPPAED